MAVSQIQNFPEFTSHDPPRPPHGSASAGSLLKKKRCDGSKANSDIFEYKDSIFVKVLCKPEQKLLL